MSLAGRTLLQMDQATSAHQAFLWGLTQRGQDPNLDRSLGLCVAGNGSQAPGVGTQPLSNFTNSQSDFVRKSSDFTGSFPLPLARSDICFVQPIGFISLMTGQFWWPATGNCFL